MERFANDPIDVARSQVEKIDAWAPLPHHYHLLVVVESGSVLLETLGDLHGRTARDWNEEDDARCRKVWFNCLCGR